MNTSYPFYDFDYYRLPVYILGLFGSTPEQSVIIDEAYECAVDAQREIFKIFFEKDDAAKVCLYLKHVKATAHS